MNAQGLWLKACRIGWGADHTIGQTVIVWQHLAHTKRWPSGVDPQPHEANAGRRVRELWPQFGVRDYVVKEPVEADAGTQTPA